MSISVRDIVAIKKARVSPDTGKILSDLGKQNNCAHYQAKPATLCAGPRR